MLPESDTKKNGFEKEALVDKVWTSRRTSRRPRTLLALLAGLLLALSVPATFGCDASTRGVTAEVPAAEEALPDTSGELVPAAIIDPLNGEEVASLDLITRRPLAIKVENDPAARPQSGLIEAEMVTEELVEGGVTRFICYFLAHDSAAVGPNRSVRPSDIDITYFLQPLLICSGGANQVMTMVMQSGLMYLEEDGTHFWRDRKRVAPHNLYTSTEKLRAYLAEQGDLYSNAVSSGLTFYTPQEVSDEQAALVNGEGLEAKSAFPIYADSIAIAYTSSCDCKYTYDPVTNSYYRFVHGKPHTDLTSGLQLAPRNVIVQYVELSSSGVRDVTGTETPNSEVIGSGEFLAFSGGEVFAGTWKKPTRNDPTRYYLFSGKELVLYPGQTWVHLIPTTVPVTMK